MFRAKHGQLNGLGFFHLHNHFGLVKDIFGLWENLSTGINVILITDTDSNSGIGLHVKFMAVFDQLAYASGYKSDAVFFDFDLFRNTDLHNFYSST